MNNKHGVKSSAVEKKISNQRLSICTGSFLNNRNKNLCEDDTFVEFDSTIFAGHILSEVDGNLVRKNEDITFSDLSSIESLAGSPNILNINMDAIDLLKDDFTGTFDDFSTSTPTPINGVSEKSTFKILDQNNNASAKKSKKSVTWKQLGSNTKSLLDSEMSSTSISDSFTTLNITGNLFVETKNPKDNLNKKSKKKIIKTPILKKGILKPASPRIARSPLSSPKNNLLKSYCKLNKITPKSVNFTAASGNKKVKKYMNLSNYKAHGSISTSPIRKVEELRKIFSPRYMVTPLPENHPMIKKEVEDLSCLTSNVKEKARNIEISSSCNRSNTNKIVQLQPALCLENNITSVKSLAKNFEQGATKNQPKPSFKVTLY